MRKKHILFISTPVGPLGSGLGGGVETTLANLVPILESRGYAIGVVAPFGSRAPSRRTALYQTKGELAPSAVGVDYALPTTVNPSGALEQMWYAASCLQNDYDAIISLSYDWLSFYLTPFFKVPVLHFLTISSQVRVVDEMIRVVYQVYPGNFALHTRSQAETFGFFKGIRLFPSAVDLKVFKFYPKAENRLVWAGRISREKGVEDAFKASIALNMPLDICGVIQDQKYWQQVRRLHKKAKFVYHGFLSQAKLNRVLGKASVMLATHKLVEAFGNTTLEALASGTPVVAYDLGGPAEIIQPGQSGYLVRPKSIKGLAAAARQAVSLPRRFARERAEAFSFGLMADNFESWIKSALFKR